MLPRPIDILPQQPPFLFIDEYLELDKSHCLAKYTFKADEWFFKGHFPGNPIVPGVILIEAMAQALTSLGLYCFAKNENMPIEKAKEKGLTLFSKVGEVEFLEMVKPSDIIYILANLIFFRFGKIETGGEIYKLVDGKKKIVCTHKSICGQKLRI